MLNKSKYRAVPIRLIDVERIERIFPVDDGVKRWAAIKNLIDFWEEKHKPEKEK